LTLSQTSVYNQRTPSPPLHNQLTMPCLSPTHHTSFQSAVFQHSYNAEQLGTEICIITKIKLYVIYTNSSVLHKKVVSAKPTKLAFYVIYVYTNSSVLYKKVISAKPTKLTFYVIYVYTNSSVLHKEVISAKPTKLTFT
jgi:hypothetical protein